MSLPNQESDVLRYGKTAVEQPADAITGYGRRAVEGGIVVAQAPTRKTPRSILTTPGSRGAFPVLSLSVRGQDGRKFSLVINAVRERVPPGETIGRFSGYRSLYHALVEASQSDRATLVFAVRNGRFRVYDSDQMRSSLSVGAVESMGPREPPKGGPFFHAVRLLNLERPRGGTSWSDRVQGASSDEDFLDLIRFATGLWPNEVNAASSSKEYVPGRLNFHRTLPQAGVCGFFRPDSANPGQLEEDPVRLRADKSGPLPVVAFSIGTGSIIRYSPVYMMTTIVHEATHEAHDLRAIQVVRVWQNTKSDNFHHWLNEQRQQQRTIAGERITLEDYQDISEKVVSGRATTEAIARIEGFTSTYHHPNYPFEEQTRPMSRIHFAEFGAINVYWKFVIKELRNELLDRLARYYDAIGSDHQEALMEYLADAEKLGDFQKELSQRLTQ